MNIITLTLSPAFDIHCYTECFKPYHENAAKLISYDAGGKGINISRALTEHKIKNTAVAILGSDNSKEFKDAMTREGISLLEIKTEGRIRENITLHTEEKGETRVSFEGFSGSDDLLFEIEEKICPAIEEGTIVALAGRLPSGISKSAVKSMLSRLKDKGARLVIDSKSFTADDLAEARPWLIKPNEEEIFQLFGLEYGGFDSAAALAEKLFSLGIENVMLTFGGEGALLISCSGKFRAQTPKITPISTVGAGDSTIAGFLSAIAKASSECEALKTAIAFGTAACLTEGTNPPKRECVAQILEKTTVKEV